MSRVSLVQRIALPLAGAVLLLQLGLAAYALDHERQTLLRQLDARAVRLANVREAFDLYGDQRDLGQLAQWLGTTLLDQKDVLFCEVKVAEDGTLFRGGTLEAEPSRRYAFPLAVEYPSHAPAEATEPGPRSATGTSAGTLYLALSTADVEGALTEARGTLTIGILAGTGFMLLLTTLIVRHTINNTVTRLLRTVKVASLRHFGNATSSRTGDALEQLGEVLDTLTTELQDVVEKEKRLTAQIMTEQGQREQAIKQ